MAQMTTINPDSIATWTEFRVPEDENLFDIGQGSTPSKSSTKWINIMRPLVEAAGHEKSQWGRVIERPDTVILATKWTSRATLQDFRDSRAHETYLAGLSAVAPPAVVLEVECAPPLTAGCWHACLGKSTAVTRVCFPRPVDAEQRRRVAGLPGMRPAAGLVTSRRHAAPQRYGPQKAWVTARAAGWDGGCGGGCEGRESDVLLWFHYWMDPQSEDVFKRSAKRAPLELIPTGDGRLIEDNSWAASISVTERFEQELRSVGAEGWKEEHCDFSMVPSRFIGDAFSYV